MAYEGMDFKEWIGEYPVHPVASLFPMIDDDALNALAEDIKKNGQREPILVAFLDGRELNEPVIVDGRNRFKACEIAGVEPEFSNDYVMEPHEIGPWVISHNLHRRHLTTSQKAAVAVAYEAELAKLAKVRQERAALAGNLNRHLDSPVKENLPEPRKCEQARDEAGNLFQVSGRSVSDAKYVSQHDPEAFQRVRDGKQAVSAAAKAIREKLNPKPELTPEQLAEKKLRPLLKENEAVIEAAFSILAEILGKEI